MTLFSCGWNAGTLERRFQGLRARHARAKRAFQAFQAFQQAMAVISYCLITKTYLEQLLERLLERSPERVERPRFDRRAEICYGDVMTGTTKGVETAVEMLRQEEADAFILSRTEQFELLEEGPAAVEAAKKRRGPGRPKGSLSRRTVQLRDAIYQHGGNPIMALAKLYAFVPIEVLAKRLGCNKLEASKIQMAALAKVAEYTDQKMPTSVEVSGSGAGPALVMEVTREEAAALGVTPARIAAAMPRPLAPAEEAVVIEGEANGVPSGDFP